MAQNIISFSYILINSSKHESELTKIHVMCIIKVKIAHSFITYRIDLVK